jgi:hypothetical protein
VVTKTGLTVYYILNQVSYKLKPHLLKSKGTTEGSDKENEQEEQTEPVNVVEKTDEEDSESERGSEMSSSECEMSEEETFRSINRIIEYEIEYVTQCS